MNARCKAMVNRFEEEKIEPPYGLPKRDMRRQGEWYAFGPLHQAKSLLAMVEEEGPYKWLLRHKVTLGPVLVTSFLLLLGTTVVMRHIQHRTRREAPPFHSPARSEPQDVLLTRSCDTG